MITLTYKIGDVEIRRGYSMGLKAQALKYAETLRSQGVHVEIAITGGKS